MSKEHKQEKLEQQHELEAQRPLVDMKTHILTVAAGLMLEKGTKDTSLKDIAKEAGISKGTLYYYYSAKDDIICDLADRNLTQITDELTKWMRRLAPELPPKAILRTLFETMLEDETRARLHFHLLNDALTSSPALAEKFRERYGTWRAGLRDALLPVMPGDPAKCDALAALVLALIDGLSVQKVCGVGDLPLSGIFDIIFR